MFCTRQGAALVGLLLLAAFAPASASAATCGDYLRHASPALGAETTSHRPFSDCHGPRCAKRQSDQRPFSPSQPLFESSPRDHASAPSPLVLDGALRTLWPAQPAAHYSLLACCDCFHPPR